MNKFLHTLFPKEFFTHPAHFRALALGVLYLGTLLAQLFTFEKFSGVIVSFGLPGGNVVAYILSWLLPILALLSLPLLMSMRMKQRLYDVSRTATVALPLFWLSISIWCNAALGAGENAGLFGATLEISVGVWQLAFTALWLWAALLVVRELPRRH